MITYDKIISFMDIVSLKMSNTIARIVTKNCHSKKISYKFDCYILHTVILAIILLLLITVICYSYPENRSKQKNIDTPQI